MSGASGGTPRRQVGDAPSPVIQAQSAVPRRGPKKNRVLEPVKSPSQRRRLIIDAVAPGDPSVELPISVATSQFLGTATLGTHWHIDPVQRSLYNDPTCEALSFYGGWPDLFTCNTTTEHEAKHYAEYKLYNIAYGRTVFLNMGFLSWNNSTGAIGQGGPALYVSWSTDTPVTWYQKKDFSGSQTSLGTMAAPKSGDIIGFAYDNTTNRIYSHINGVWNLGNAPDSDLGVYTGFSESGTTGYAMGIGIQVNNATGSPDERAYEIGPIKPFYTIPDGYTAVT